MMIKIDYHTRKIATIIPSDRIILLPTVRIVFFFFLLFTLFIVHLLCTFYLLFRFVNFCVRSLNFTTISNFIESIKKTFNQSRAQGNMSPSPPGPARACTYIDTIYKFKFMYLNSYILV